MSINRNIYVIAGCDLTKYKTDKYSDWRWTEAGEELLCKRQIGQICLFDDPMDGNHLYLGYLLADGDEVSMPTYIASIRSLYDYSLDTANDIINKIEELGKMGVINITDNDWANDKNLRYSLLCFEEWT